jgi:Uma2 family endonuclease
VVANNSPLGYGEIVTTLAEQSKPSEARVRRYNYDTLRAELPETNQPHELWDGELIMAPAPLFDHQKITLRFYRLLDDWAVEHDLGEVIASPIDMVLSPHRVVQPDVAFISKERLNIIQGAILGPADLVAEVISLGSRNRDRIEKRDLFEQHGVKEYWLVDPESETVDVLFLVNSRYELAMHCKPGQNAKSQLLAGFELSVQALLRGSNFRP